MNEENRLLKFFNTSISDHVYSLTAPLKRCFGIDVFWHSRITDTGLFNHVSNTPEGTIHYFQNKYYLNNPFLRHPKNYTEGYYLLSDFPLGSYGESQQKYNQMFGMDHILYICHHQKGVCHLFGFATSQKNLFMVNIYLNNLTLLRKFSQYFLEQCEPFIPKLEEFKVNLSQLVGSSFFTLNEEGIIGTNRKKQHHFLEILGWKGFHLEQLKTLTRREKECLELFLKGKTAQQTAALLNISRRTVEFHFENMKDKLGCFNKAEIFERYSSNKEHFLL